MPIEIPGYKILKKLGQGGMATVYLAEQEIFERQIALKVMSKSLSDDPSFGKRFFREAKIVSNLVHPNIITVHNVGQHEDYYYLSMEHIDGYELKAVKHQLSLQEKIHVVRDVASALAYAGDRGFVHRDIKPENIMLHRTDGRVILMDFGIARAAKTDTQMTQEGMAIGTPHYMSPEQAQGKEVDTRSDIYSLGAVFFLLLTGYVPYDADSAVAIGIKHITDPVPTLPEGLEPLQPLIDGMMAKALEERFETAHALIEELDNLDFDIIEEIEAAAKAAYIQVEDISNETPTVDMSKSSVPLLVRPISGVSRSTSAERFTIADGQFEMEEKASLWPWLVGLLILLSVGGGVLYQQQPTWLTAYIPDLKTNSQLPPPLNAGTNNEPKTEQTLVPSSLPPLRTTQDDDRTHTDKLSASEESSDTTNNSPAIDTEATATITTPSADTTDTLPTQAPTSDISQAAVTPTAEQASALELEKQRQSLLSLREQTPADKQALTLQVQSYRQYLAKAPDDTEINTAFETLQSSLLQRVSKQIENGEFTSATTLLEQLKKQFDDTPKATFESLSTRLTQQQRLATLYKQAQEYASNSALTRPSGGNAIEAFKEVLSLAPKHKGAKQGLSDVYKRLNQIAKRAIQNHEFNKAKRLLNIVLSDDKSNTTAKSLTRQIATIRTENIEIETLSAKAQAQQSNGFLFEPDRSSAFDYYQQILVIRPKHSATLSGIRQLSNDFIQEVKLLIQNDKLETAKYALSKAQVKLPNNTDFKQLLGEVENAIQIRFEASQPRISNLALSATDFNTLVPVVENLPVQARHSLFIGFDYINLQSDATLFQVQLWDGARSLLILEASTIVQGVQGRATLSLDRPVKGFPVGTYVMDVLLANQALSSILFQVE